MAKKVVPFPTPAQSSEPEPISQRHSRLVLCIGRRRLAFDFYSRVTELNPAPAPIVSVNNKNNENGAKSRQRGVVTQEALGGWPEASTWINDS